jgi:hypothetical protein
MRYAEYYKLLNPILVFRLRFEYQALFNIMIIP